VKKEIKLVTLLTNAKAKMTAKPDKAKAMGKILAGFRMEIEKPLDKKIKSDPPATLPLHFATPCNISIFKSVVSDPSDHHFQILTVGDLSDCKMLCLARQTTPVPAKTVVNAFADPDSIQLFKIPADRHQNLHRNPFVPDQPLSSRARKSENDLYHDSFIFNYLDFSR
jgi:hypothetical protein